MPGRRPALPRPLPGAPLAATPPRRWTGPGVAATLTSAAATRHRGWPRSAAPLRARLLPRARGGRRRRPGHATQVASPRPSPHMAHQHARGRTPGIPQASPGQPPTLGTPRGLAGTPPAGARRWPGRFPGSARRDPGTSPGWGPLLPGTLPAPTCSTAGFCPGGGGHLDRFQLVQLPGPPPGIGPSVVVGCALRLGAAAVPGRA